MRLRVVQVWLCGVSTAFGRTPQAGWLQLQLNYDLALVNQKADRFQVTPFVRPEADLIPT
ncbi:MAG: hypothetical protein R2844_11135 [Caldilineales bacterium]